MTEFLTTKDTASAVERILRRAAERIVLVTPYLSLSPMHVERMRDADQWGVPITIIYRKGKLRAADRNKLQELEHLSLYSLENLHAKCFLNEHQAVIGSLNLYEYSEANNWEMGVLLTREEDAQAYQDAVREVDTILRAATADPPRRVVTKALRQRREKTGRCIRCGSSDHYAPTMPLCDTCYPTWAAWGNDDYPERFCHRCGDETPTSKRRPLCAPCYAQDPFMSGGTW